MGISLIEIKKYLRVSHNIDDDFITELIESEKMYVKNVTGVEYSVDDLQYNQLIMLLVHQHYYNRGATSEKGVNEMPFSANSLLNHIGLRGALSD